MAFVRFVRNPISFAGIALATASAVLFLIVFLADVFGWHTNPYLGIVFFLVLPAFFVLGLLIIPLGAWFERRRRQRGRAASDLRWLRLDLNDPVQRRATFIVVVLTIINVVIVSLASYRGVEYMDSVQFCGQVCHGVMKPEFVAYQDGPHSRVACVQCHIGPGAPSFARSKLSGMRQVFAVTLKTYSRPIPSPVQSLRPARDTCEQCHWPEKFHGDVIRRVTEYADDEKNTESVTTLNVHVGGGSEKLGIAQGIHWHMNLANEVEYIATDDKRQVIPWVRLKDRFGHVREYVAPGTTPEQLQKGERRRMDCMDCHNRPSHTMAPTPEKAINQVMARGDIPRDLPFVHREAVKALKAAYPTQDAADEGISRSVRDFYQSQYRQLYVTRREDVDKAVRATAAVYRRNVFPEMNVQFGTYPNNIGHIDFPGCFRCHDDNHVANDGKKISQDCETCHKIE
jgi:nitrate/TMAO reductase-like tetraheme cytochrome c subunit